MTVDRYGRRWTLPVSELCPTCGQPDNCGECNHERLSDREALSLGAGWKTLATFEVLWYSGGEHSHAPNRVIGRDMIERPDMPAALRAACNMLVDGGGAGEGMAKGFYVRKVNA